MTLTLIKCNLTMALLWCIRDCSDWIEMSPENEKSPLAISKAIECRTTCLECLEAFESSKTSTRGLLTRAVSHACWSLLNECQSRGNRHMQKCMESCQRCIEECENILSIQGFSNFFIPEDSWEMVS